MSDEDDDYKVVANKLKEEANVEFQNGNIEKSIDLYTQAINIDPDNHVLYSNRAASYMKVNSISKSLHDAEKCLELNPNFVKGYNRLGLAQQSLKRYDAALETYKKGIKLDPNNTALWSLLNACQEALDKEKQFRYSEAAKEREQEEERIKNADEEKERLKKEKQQNELSNFLNEIETSQSSSSAPSSSSSFNTTNASSGANNDDDLLSGFFTEVVGQQNKVTNVKEAVIQSKKAESKYANQDLGNAESQFERLTQKNYEWRNLNPFYVLQLGIDATEDDIKNRYKNLSRLVHPDKLVSLGKDNAREAFEQVKTAYQKLQDEKQTQVILMNIEYVKDEMEKERRRLISKGLKEQDLPMYDAELERRTIKHFAEIEMQKRRSETNLRFYNARERIKEDEEKELVRLQEEKEKSWAEVERREKRVGEWRNFQDDPESKKVKLATFKEEHRQNDEKKYGKVDLESWKKNWR